MASALLVAATLGVALVAIGMFPADLPRRASPTFVDTIFDNRGVIWAARPFSFPLPPYSPSEASSPLPQRWFG